jgi:hypothetical protein
MPVAVWNFAGEHDFDDNNRLISVHISNPFIYFCYQHVAPVVGSKTFKEAAMQVLPPPPPPSPPPPSPPPFIP